MTGVTVWRRPDDNVCLRHGLWIGAGVTSPADQMVVSDLPEVFAAQRAHARMIRRFGHREVGAAYDCATSAVEWSTCFPSSVPRWSRLQHFRDRGGINSLPGACDAAAMYPEAVLLTSVLVSPHWRRMSIGNRRERASFFGQVGRCGFARGRPELNAPLQQWIDRQRWPWPEVPYDVAVAEHRRSLPPSPVVEQDTDACEQDAMLCPLTFGSGFS
jgi:hypothetical protein